jgi:hypothetical protein
MLYGRDTNKRWCKRREDSWNGIAKVGKMRRKWYSSCVLWVALDVSLRRRLVFLVGQAQTIEEAEQGRNQTQRRL